MHSLINRFLVDLYLFVINCIYVKAINLHTNYIGILVPYMYIVLNLIALPTSK